MLIFLSSEVSTAGLNNDKCIVLSMALNATKGEKNETMIKIGGVGHKS